MDRVEHYLSRLLKEHGKWVRITKLKQQRPSKENTSERQTLIKQITSALDLMGVKYEVKSNTHFTLKVIPEIPIGLHIDPAVYSGFDTTIMYGYRMNGKKAQMVIFDDIWKTP